MNLSSMSLAIDVTRGGIAGTPPPVYTPVAKFNDTRNSMYVGAFYSI